MNDEIGKRIRSRRNELNITQQQIYKEIGISSGNLSGIESGKSLPSASALIGLSKVLDCSIDWILTGNSKISESTFFNNREKDLLDNFRRLSNNDQEEILEIILLKIKRNSTNLAKSYTSADIKTNNSSNTKIS